MAFVDATVVVAVEVGSSEVEVDSSGAVVCGLGGRRGGASDGRTVDLASGGRGTVRGRHGVVRIDRRDVGRSGRFVPIVASPVDCDLSRDHCLSLPMDLPQELQHHRPLP